MKRFLLGFLLLPFLSFGQSVLLVPSQYNTIQNAINSSSNGDTILISPGVYNEAISFSGKDIIISSEFINNQDPSYISNTIIDGTTLSNQDIVASVVGGIKISEPTADLALSMAIASSYYDIPLDYTCLFLGEIGFTG